MGWVKVGGGGQLRQRPPVGSIIVKKFQEKSPVIDIFQVDAFNMISRDEVR